MRPAPVQPDSDRLLDFVVVALAVVALGVSVSGLTRTPPRLEPSTLPPAKAKPALVKLDPTKLRTAPTANADSAAVAPDAALAPAPLAPITSLPDMNLPALPEVPTLSVRQKPVTAAVPSVGKTGATGAARGGVTAGPIVLDVAEMAGRQPWPEYPYECLRRRESGIVRVEFEVGENGAVRRARAVNTSGCHRLDEAATDTILRRWEFPAGDVRLYEISIQFQLQ
jgi:protein TonB